MNIRRFIGNNLTYYWKKNLLLALGIAISGAVITGALMVGDSVKYSLNRIVEHRLGKVTHVLKSGDRYFTTGLTERVGAQLKVPVSSLLMQEGSAIAGGGQLRINHIRVLGVDEAFDQLTGMSGYYNRLSADSIIISQNLANRLQMSVGDEVLLRIERASLIPLNAPFVSDAESVVSVRATIIDIANTEQVGRFNLKVSQTAPFNVFMAQSRLQELMEFTGRVNVMLLDAGEQMDGEAIMSVIDQQFSAADAGLKLSLLEDQQQLEVTSDRVFIDEIITDRLHDATGSEGEIQSEDGIISGEGHHSGEGILSGEGIVTYFVNEMQFGDNSTPYSFVSTLPARWLRPEEIIINKWLADDLGAGEGDTLIMTYFEVGPLRELNEVSAQFVVKAVVPLEGRFGDRTLMPNLPGLSDAGNCRDWDTGVPIELGSIRDKDEDYWDQYGGIPKAFISISKGKELWTNRFGTYTSFRVGLETDLRIEPAMLGFTIESARSKGDEAAGSGVDFSQLFGGLSFFLLLSGILLTILLFLLNLESRQEQLRTLVVMGIPVKIIRRIMFVESMTVAIGGAAAGLVLALFYNRLVFLALNGVWRDVVRTEMMHVDIRIVTLATGLAITLVVALLALWFPLNRKLRQLFRSHKKPSKPDAPSGDSRIRKTAAFVSVVAAAGAVSQIAPQLVRMEVVNTTVFFTAGGLLLLSAVFFFLWFLSKKAEPAGSRFDLPILSWKNATRNRTRSMSIVALFAIGAFLVISTGSNRKDLFVNSEDPASGTGGFLYYAESTIPVLQQLNDPQVRYQFGLGEGYSIVQLRKADGDDASCLNLNKIVNPQVLGVDPDQLDNRYSFVTRTAFLDEEHPWLSLGQELPGGLIPAIADETVIKWGLGLAVGDTLHYTNSSGGTMDLLLIGGLAPSVFQGNVIIANAHFLEQFPESSGTQVFLVDGELSDTAMIKTELGRGMRDLGWDMQMTSVRLASFNSVTNAYLSIFLVMGALGLLLGTFGLVVVLSRSILERRQEIALLKAVGFTREKIRRLITREYMILLLAGILTGFATAIIATLPSIVSAHTGTSFTSILLWLVILMANGWLWIQVVTRSALKNPHIYTGLRNE